MRHSLKEEFTRDLQTLPFLDKTETGLLLDYYIKIGHIYNSIFIFLFCTENYNSEFLEKYHFLSGAVPKNLYKVCGFDNII